MDDRPASLKMLREVHTFPGPYVVKAIGENTPEFVARVMQAVVVVLGRTSVPEVRTRHSAKGTHQSVNLTVQVADAEQVLQIYEALKGLAGLRFLL